MSEQTYTPRSAIVSVLLLSSLILMITDCKHSTDPPIEPPKNPREYTWTVDTLLYPNSIQTWMKDIWGSSGSQVFAVGHCDSRGVMWQFDGSKWSQVRLSRTDGGMIDGSIDLNAIHGFSASDIWAVGEKAYSPPTGVSGFLDSSLIIHYDGHQWVESNIVRGRGLRAIWGSSPEDIWAGGGNGTLYRYDGLSWRKSQAIDSIYYLSFAGLNSSEIYAIGIYFVETTGRDLFYLLQWDGNQWKILDTWVLGESPKFGGQLFAISGSIYSSGTVVWRKTPTGWQSMLSGNSISIYGMAGTANDNIFAVGGFYGEAVYHYNGRDWFRFPQFSNPTIMYTKVWIDGKEVFVTGYDVTRTYILHGR
jgi:hypothetical protein